MAKTVKNSQESPRKVVPAQTPESREKQLIALAVDLVEQRLLNGTASSQETTHFLKLGSSRARLENERLRQENELLKAKTEAIQTSKTADELYAKAIKAFGMYRGETYDEEDE